MEKGLSRILAYSRIINQLFNANYYNITRLKSELYKYLVLGK